MDLRIILTITILTLIIYYSMTYFGLYRYIMMHNLSFKDLADNYKNLTNADNVKVILSFTAQPEEIENITPFINSLLDQTVKINQIAFNIPADKEYKIDPLLKSVVNVFKCGKDYDEANKIVPTLLREGESDAKIIILNPNYVYGKDFIENVVNISNKLPDNAIVLTDKSAVLVKPKFFTTDSIGLLKSMCTENNDDLSWLINSINAPLTFYEYNGTFRNIF